MKGRELTKKKDWHQNVKNSLPHQFLSDGLFWTAPFDQIPSEMEVEQRYKLFTLFKLFTLLPPPLSLFTQFKRFIYSNCVRETFKNVLADFVR